MRYSVGTLPLLGALSAAFTINPNKFARSAASLTSSTCQVAPTGAGPVAKPDTEAGFQAYPNYGNTAAKAKVPANYTEVFSNLTASTSTSGYLGYLSLDSYAPSTCASICDQVNGCKSFNLYYERDPGVTPAPSCPNPESTVFIKCVLWSGVISADTATNRGQWLQQFHVLIAGSNGYTRAAVASSSAEAKSLNSSSSKVFTASTVGAPVSASAAASTTTKAMSRSIFTSSTVGAPVMGSSSPVFTSSTVGAPVSASSAVASTTKAISTSVYTSSTVGAPVMGSTKSSVPSSATAFTSSTVGAPVMGSTKSSKSSSATVFTSSTVGAPVMGSTKSSKSSSATVFTSSTVGAPVMGSTSMFTSSTVGSPVSASSPSSAAPKTSSSSITSSTFTVTSTRSTFSTTYSSSFSTSPTTPSNPVQTAGRPAFLGNVSASNTFDIRDLGWQGNIGSTWINTYGDTIPCSKAWARGCFGLEAPNSGSVATDDPTKYIDINLGPSGNHAQIFCPHRDGEPTGFGLGLTNVVEIGPETGIVFFLRNNRTGPSYLMGSGVAVVDTSSGKPNCTRPTLYWWDSETEPYWGDHGAILAPDGYIYAYGGFGNVTDGHNDIFVARVPRASALHLDAYEYWDGEAFTPERLYNPTDAQSVMHSGQGSIVYSPHYGKFLYFKPGCPGGSCILVTVADQPQGPWSTGYGIWGTGDSPDHFLMYAPAAQPKFSDPMMKNLVLMYTGRGQGFGNLLQAINISFV